MHCCRTILIRSERKNHKAFTNPPAITISAWVSPTDLSGYREIFRKEDGNNRILFSFQHDGQILALGLNVEGSGYEEVRQIDDPQFQGIDWLAIRPQIKNAPQITRPGPINTP